MLAGTKISESRDKKVSKQSDFQGYRNKKIQARPECVFTTMAD